VNSRLRHHDSHRARRNLRRQRQRAMASVARDPSADLWVGYWCSLDDLLLEYARAGVADAIREHLDSHPRAQRETLTHALLFAEAEWRDRTNDRQTYIATMEVLLAAGADPSILSADVMGVLPTFQAREFDAELSAPIAPARTASRL